MYGYGRQYSLFDACIYNSTSAALVMTWSVVPADPLLHAKLEVLSLQMNNISHRFVTRRPKVCVRNIHCVSNGCPDPSAFTTAPAVLSGIKYVYERKKMAPLISLKSIFSPAPCHFPTNYFFSFFFLLLSSSTFPFLSFPLLPIHKTSKMVKSAVLGYPRIGVNRAMKKVSRSHRQYTTSALFAVNW